VRIEARRFHAFDIGVRSADCKLRHSVGITLDAVCSLKLISEIRFYILFDAGIPKRFLQLRSRCVSRIH
jgi:hypothetical protein